MEEETTGDLWTTKAVFRSLMLSFSMKVIFFKSCMFDVNIGDSFKKLLRIFCI